jgi:hypothetical protein
VLLQLKHRLLIGVLPQVNDGLLYALIPVLDDPPEDIAGFPHIDTGTGCKDEVQEVTLVILHIPQFLVVLQDLLTIVG